mgnify:CR=1 FL=1
MTKVLIVEDEAISALLIQKKLAAAGLDVLPPVATGEKAVELALNEKPDIVFMDIRLAGRMDGIEAAGRIRAVPALEGINVLPSGEQLLEPQDVLLGGRDLRTLPRMRCGSRRQVWKKLRGQGFERRQIPLRQTRLGHPFEQRPERLRLAVLDRKSVV